jgi:hypothetical protein
MELSPVGEALFFGYVITTALLVSVELATLIYMYFDGLKDACFFVYERVTESLGLLCSLFQTDPWGALWLEAHSCIVMNLGIVLFSGPEPKAQWPVDFAFGSRALLSVYYCFAMCWACYFTLMDVPKKLYYLTLVGVTASLLVLNVDLAFCFLLEALARRRVRYYVEKNTQKQGIMIFLLSLIVFASMFSHATFFCLYLQMLVLRCAFALTLMIDHETHVTE